MNKTKFYSILCAILMLSTIIELKPMAGRIMMRTLYAASAGMLGTLNYLTAHLVQRNRVNNIGKSYLESSMERMFIIHNERKGVSLETVLEDSHNNMDTLRTITTSGLLAMNLAQKQAIL